MSDGTTSAATHPAEAGASLKRRVASGTAWTIVSYGGGQVLRLGSNIVLAKWFFPPAVFGLMTFVNIFVTGLAMFSDVGIGPSIIQSKRGEEPRFLNTAWTVQVVRGFLLWLASLALAGWYANLYDQPELKQLVPAAALSATILGFNSTRFFTAGRRIALARVTILDFISQVVGTAATIAFCFATRSIWAIVYGSLVAAAAKMALTYFLLDGERNAFAWDPEAFREMSRFGRWVFLSTALMFLAGQIDRFVLGKVVTLDVFGLYGIGFNLASLPPMMALSFTGQLLFPLLAHHSRNDAKAYEQALFTARRVILEGGWFLFAGLVLVSPAFFHALYKPTFWGAIRMTQLLVVAMWGWVLVLSADRALLAVGDSRTLAISNAASFLAKLGACTLGLHLGGMPGFILGLAAGNLAGHVPVVLALRRRGVNILPQDFRYTALAGATIGGAYLLQRAAVGDAVGWMPGVIEVAISLLVIVPLGVRLYRNGRELLAARN
jgi:O-antigen/teichoic acid export membrane protein